MRDVRFRHDEEARRFLVEAVDDARPLHTPDPGEGIAAMVEEGVDERPIRISRAGMHDEPGRLVDDEEVLVLIDHRELDRFGLRLRRLRLGKREFDAVAGGDPEVGILEPFAIQMNPALLDQRLQAAAGVERRDAREISVDPFARIRRLDLERFRL